MGDFIMKALFKKMIKFIMKGLLYITIIIILSSIIWILFVMSLVPTTEDVIDDFKEVRIGENRLSDTTSVQELENDNTDLNVLEGELN